MEAKLVGTTYVNSRFQRLAVCRYEYRGHEYFIEFDNINIKPSHIYAQDHRSEQNRIDNLINQVSQPKIENGSNEQAMKAFFEEVNYLDF